MYFIKGKTIANRIEQSLKHYFKDLNFVPTISIFLINDDEPSIRYTNLKKKKSEELGVKCEIVSFDRTVNKNNIINTIKNVSKHSDGIVIQLPLFENLENFRNEILNSIPEDLDIDCLSEKTLAKILTKDDPILPASAQAALEVLKEINITKFDGLNILIINNSNLVGIPLSIYLSKRNATVTTANKSTKNLKALIFNSDIVITATGKTNLISPDMVKENTIVIDITSVKTQDGKIIGDFFNYSIDDKKQIVVTPVPGGIGPLTIACLFDNLRKFLTKKGVF